MEYISNCEQDTIIIAKSLGEKMKGGEVIILNGELGAGKTAFSKGLALGLKIDDIITSPTFTILNVYQGKLNFYHFDMYRLEDENELKELGFEEYIGNSNGVCAIEWISKTPSLMTQNAIVVNITKLGIDTRKIEIIKEE